MLRGVACACPILRSPVQQLVANASLQRAASSLATSTDGASEDAFGASTSGRSISSAEILAQYNLSLPSLQNQVILAKVVSTSGRSVLVDPGYFGFCEFPKRSISMDQLHDPDGKALAGRDGKIELRPGDLVKFELRHFFSPYGEMYLEPLRTGGDVQSSVIWEELKQAMEENKHVVGRVLNACKDGYAVGLSGYVALLPYRNSRVETVRKVGVLQKFFIQRMDDVKKVIVVSDAKLARDVHDESGSSLYSNI